MRAYPPVRSEDFGVSRFLSGPIFDASISSVCRHLKMQNAGKIWALRRPKFMSLAILSTTFPISPFFRARRDAFSKYRFMQLGQFFSEAAPIGGRNRF